MAELTVRLFAHTNHEHGLTSTQIVAKLQQLFHFFLLPWRKAVAAGAEV